MKAVELSYMEIMYGPTAIQNGPAHLAQSEDPSQPTTPLLILVTSIHRTADNPRKHASSDTTPSPVAADCILLFQAWTLGRGSLPPARAWARVLAVSVRLIPFFLASLGFKSQHHPCGRTHGSCKAQTSPTCLTEAGMPAARRLPRKQARS